MLMTRHAVACPDTRQASGTPEWQVPGRLTPREVPTRRPAP
jgi:hypothetical protein